MTVDDLLHVAWRAQLDGRPQLREAMLTLAIAESGPDDGWAERCRARLLAGRPNHFLGAQPTLERTMADPRVAEAIRKLRGQYPPARVRWLRFRSEFAAGPFTGEDVPMGTLLGILIGPPAEAEVRRDEPERPRGPMARSKAEVMLGVAESGSFRAFAAGSGEAIVEAGSSEEVAAADDSTVAFYLSVLLAIALLLSSVRQGRELRAA